MCTHFHFEQEEKNEQKYLRCLNDIFGVVGLIQSQVESLNINFRAGKKYGRKRN